MTRRGEVRGVGIDLEFVSTSLAEAPAGRMLRQFANSAGSARDLHR